MMGWMISDQFSNLRRPEIVIELTIVAFWSRTARIFLQKLVGDRVAMNFIKWSSLALAFVGRSSLPWFLNVSEFWKFTIAICSSVFPTTYFYTNLTFIKVIVYSHKLVPSYRWKGEYFGLYSKPYSLPPNTITMASNLNMTKHFDHKFCVNNGWLNNKNLLHRAISYGTK